MGSRVDGPWQLQVTTRDESNSRSRIAQPIEAGHFATRGTDAAKVNPRSRTHTM